MADDDLTIIFTAGDLHDSGAPGELAIHRDGRLFWNGDPVVIERPLSLTFPAARLVALLPFLPPNPVRSSVPALARARGSRRKFENGGGPCHKLGGALSAGGAKLTG